MARPLWSALHGHRADVLEAEWFRNRSAGGFDGDRGCR
jgi:hypothetical protein